VERVSKGAGSPGFVAFAAPLDTAFTSPFATPFDKLRTWLRTQFRPTRDAYGLSPEVFVAGIGRRDRFAGIKESRLALNMNAIRRHPFAFSVHPKPEVLFASRALVYLLL